MFDSTKAIIFDLDDTLYLQRHFKESGFNAISDWLQVHKAISTSDSLSHLQSIINEHGPSYPYMFDALVERLLLEKDLIPILIKLFREHTPQIELFLGVSQMLELLKTKYVLGLLTDGTWAVQQKKVNSLGIAHFFDLIVYSDSLGLTKPAPELYELIENKLNLTGEYLAYVGDNPQKDFVEAKRRGWLTCRVLTGEFGEFTQKPGFEADCTVPSVVDIIRFTPLISISRV